LDTDTAWEQWGARDPYYGVLTDPKFRAAAITADGKEQFFASGKLHVDHVIEQIRKGFDPAFEPARVLDFGCGVGRLLVAFAGHAKEVVGMDVSRSMRAEAQRNCDARGLGHVAIVASDDRLSAAAGSFDLVHSCLVLQHVEVARGRDIFAQLVSRIRPGGFGALQVTFAWDLYAESFGQPPPPPPPPPPSAMARLKRLLRRCLAPFHAAPEPVVAPVVENPDPEMQMNYYNLSELMFVLQRAAVHRVQVELADHGGAFGALLIFQRGF
jgi:SAM-dependent methyltransferase